MSRREFLRLAAAGFAATLAAAARAQKATGIPRIGVLLGASPPVEAARLAAFRGALERLGYVDGQSILIEPRYAEGHADRFNELASELAALQPNVLACVGTPETRALQTATQSIPIVFMQAQDPVELGFVASLAQPGGNTTGFSMMSAELDAKRLQLLREIAPSLSRAAFLTNPGTSPRLAKRLADAEAVASLLGLTLQPIQAASSGELTAGFAAIEAAQSQALLIQGDPLLTGTESPRIINFAISHRLPTAFENNSTVQRGGLFSYGQDLLENARLAAGYVGKILDGAKPADLPVQQPAKFVLAINLKTARQIGMTVPQSIVARADEVVE
jgi:ABC-type uncharacterized transport system substrate-binding protein